MPFKSGAQWNGNAGGRPSDKVFTDRLRLALLEPDPKTKRNRLDRVVSSLIDNAIAGEGWAVAQIADRLEGKPHQTSETTIHNRPVTEMTTAELLRIAAQGRTDEPQVTEDGDQTTH
jgi:hypothetical protein